MGFIRSKRRNRIVREKLLPADTWRWLVHDHPILFGLTEGELAQLRGLSTVFLHEKVFEGADGLVLNQPMREVIAVQACLPILHMGLEWYENWKTIVVMPDVFVEEHTAFDAAGVVHEWNAEKSGESLDARPVLLSWKDIEASGWGEGNNVIIHEAAHRLDLLDGKVNGRPSLHKGMDPEEWRIIFSNAYQDLRRKARRHKRGQKIDVCAVEDPGEFFAVTTEYFFEQPEVLSREYPDVYRLMAAFYKQDPGRRIHRP
jgi:hypothetical protein